jgi:hypothetical protein
MCSPIKFTPVLIFYLKSVIIEWLSIDFKAAFNIISHSYLFTILTTYGFSVRFKAYIHGMYTNTSSSILIYGHTYWPKPIKRSVRQVCPLSMQNFEMCLDPLLHTIENSLTGIRFGNKSRIAVMAYVDDVTLLVASPSEIPRIRTITDQYVAASGAKINI